jgi:hypothetical protein
MDIVDLIAKMDERLTRVETMLEQQQTLLAAVRSIGERGAMQRGEIQQTLARHGKQLHDLQQTLEAIKDMLDRGNGH